MLFDGPWPSLFVQAKLHDPINSRPNASLSPNPSPILAVDYACYNSFYVF